jgi:hypothetical protein
MTGVAFRETSGYVTDAPGFSSNTGQAYPTTIGGVVQGWPTNRSGSARDRATSSGPKLAGINFVANGAAAADYRIDVSPGTYEVRLALGDLTNGQENQKVVIKDGGTTRATVSAASIVAASFVDATGVTRESGFLGSDWETSNQPVTVVISSGQLILSVGDPVGTGVTTIAYVEWTLAAGGGGGSTAQGATLAATVSMFGGTATGGVASGTFTSEVLKRNNGTLAASVALTYVRFYSTSTGALVLTKTGLSTNGSGVFTTTDAALVSGTTYGIDWEEAGGQRRMPRKAAT